MLRRITGNRPASLVAGILLLSKARTFGQPIDIEVVLKGGPCHMQAPLVVKDFRLAGLGVSHIDDVVLLGETSNEVVQVYVSQWGSIPLARSPEHCLNVGRILFSMLRQGGAVREALVHLIHHLGLVVEPFVFDALFAEHVPPLQALQFARLISSEVSGKQSGPLLQRINRADSTDAVGLELLKIRLNHTDRLDLLLLLRDVPALLSSEERQVLIDHLLPFVELFSVYPTESLLPKLPKEVVEIAKVLPFAVGYTGFQPLCAQLERQFLALGGRLQKETLPSFDLGGGDNRDNDWVWFLEQVAVGERGAEQLWRQMMDSIQ